MLHYGNATLSQCQLHTRESILEIRDRLMICQPTMSKTKFEDECKVFGFNFNPDGLLYDRYLTDSYVNPLDHHLHDPMHVLVASSGIGQYEVNAFINALLTKADHVDMLDTFAAQCTVHGRGLYKDFFKRRVKYNRSDSFRGFADDCMQADWHGAYDR